jgi:hypothetical protein
MAMEKKKKKKGKIRRTIAHNCDISFSLSNQCAARVTTFSNKSFND